MDEAIKRALEVAAAVDWAQRSGGDVKAWPMTHSRLAIAMCQQDRERTAAAIAAFLEACPLVSDQPPGMDRMGFFDENARARWAAAVRRAAGGG